MTKALAPNGIPILFGSTLHQSSRQFYIEISHVFLVRFIVNPLNAGPLVGLICFANQIKTPINPKPSDPSACNIPKTKFSLVVTVNSFRNPHFQNFVACHYMHTCLHVEPRIVPDRGRSLPPNERALQSSCQGSCAPRLVGRASDFIGLRKIFDVVNRNHVLRSLEFFEIDNNLQLVHAWMMPHEHCIPLWFLLGDFRPCLLVENYSMETRGDEHTPRL